MAWGGGGLDSTSCGSVRPAEIRCMLSAVKIKPTRWMDVAREASKEQCGVCLVLDAGLVTWRLSFGVATQDKESSFVANASDDVRLGFTMRFLVSRSV